MKVRKKIFSGLFVIVFCLLAILGRADAAEGTTEVQIEIEASELPVSEEKNTTDIDENVEKIQTGDEKNPTFFIGMIVIAVAIIVFLLRRRKKLKGMFAVLLVILGVVCANQSAKAADTAENVSVTIPSNILIAFEETGANSVGEFKVSNQSLVPVTLEQVYVTEYNGWKLIESGSEIPADTKELVFEMENQCLLAGNNSVDVVVPENTERELAIEVTRGAWTSDKEAEMALKLEFEYEVGAKEFVLSFDSNGSSESVAPMQVLNGTIVTLPVIARAGYALTGWQDSAGNVYTGSYTMPIGNVTLKAIWAETEAYAIYSATDGSLTFCRSKTPIQAGTTYNGKTVTAVYTGFEDANYTSNTSVPWHSYRAKILKIIAEDEIQPACVAYWFVSCEQCYYVDVGKIDTSRVTSMRQTFSLVGLNVTDKVTILGVDKWDVSKVTITQSMFNATGRNAASFYMDDISGWDVSSVTRMSNMFVNFALISGFSMDLRGWNVQNAELHGSFNKNVETTILAPTWVN